MGSQHFAHAVVGRGLMGAAAGRHLAKSTEGVALIGPGEPKDRRHHHGVFASYYGQSRITRILDPDPIWALLAKRAVTRYRELEKESGVKFFHELGHLAVGPAPSEQDNYIDKLKQVGNDLGIQYDSIDHGELPDHFPYLNLPRDFVGIYQGKNAGYINPRALVEAQTRAAEQLGSTIVSAEVEAVKVDGDVAHITTRSGKKYTTENVLIAAGGFTNAPGLLSQKLDLALCARTLLFIEVGRRDVDALAGMPPIIYRNKLAHEHYYLVPPLLFPDGKYYLKIGSSYVGAEQLSTTEELCEWFRGSGNKQARDKLLSACLNMLPGLKPISIRTESCAYTCTPTRKPYVDRLPEKIAGVLTGGNGMAAKSSDEFGRMGAEMMLHDDWSYDIDARVFEASYRSAAN